MARIILDEKYGPVVRVTVNGRSEELTPGQEEVVTASVLGAIEDANLEYERIYRTTQVQLAALTLDNDSIADDAVADDPVGAIEGSQDDSTLEMTDDADGLFALDGLNVIVADTLTEGSYDIEITETNEEIVNSPLATTISITVTAAA